MNNTELLSILLGIASPTCDIHFIGQKAYASTASMTFCLPNPFPEIDGMAFKSLDIVNALKKFPECKATRKEETVVFSHGRSKLTLVSLAFKYNPIIFQTEKTPLTVPASFRTGLEICYTSGNRSPYSGVYVDDTRMIATDGQRMSFYDLDTPMETFWINDSSVKTLLKYSFTEHVMLPEYILFYNKEFTIAVKRLRDNIYPVGKLEAVYKMLSEADTFNIPNGFASAVEKAASMGVEDGICKIFLTFEDDYSIITGDKRTGTYEEEIEGAAMSGKFIGLYKHLSVIADGDVAGLANGYLFIRRQDSFICMAGLREEQNEADNPVSGK